MSDLKQVTETLKSSLIRLKERYEQSSPPKNRKDRDFFNMVKQETDPLYQLLDEWEDIALASVKERKVGIHPQQVVSTKENMELLLMHSYFIDTRHTRYMDLYQSVLFIFDQVLSEIKSDE